jgi:hypothetical protein
MRVDLHAHTWYSADAITSPSKLVRRARRAGLDRIAVTDHGAIAGALAAKAVDPDLIIVGEEIRCRCGTDLIGLFLNEWIAPGQALEETARLIRAQGGVVYAPHPYAYLTIPSRRAARVLAVADVIEVFNSRAVVPMWNRRAAQAATQLTLPRAASTDAHTPWEIGRAYTELPPFSDAPSFLASLAGARVFGERTGSPFLHFFSLTVQGLRTVLGRGHGQPPWSYGRASKQIEVSQRGSRPADKRPVSGIS